jgi:hypothetical protein
LALIEGEINEIIAASIDKCFDNIGRGFRGLFYWSLENRAGIRRDEIAERPYEFVRYLERMFLAGSSIVEEEMKTQISVDLGIPWSSNDLAALIRFAMIENSCDDQAYNFT